MKNFTRRTFLRTAAYSAGAACTLPLLNCSLSKNQNRPNIIFILTDDLGYGELGCYGQERILTPNIDQLAKEGMRFTDFYAGSTVCAPSRCSLMTGMHTGHSLIRGNLELKPKMGQFPLPENTQTIATLLKSKGYTTGAIGKWGLGGPGSEGVPNKHGFDYFYGYLCQRHAHNYYPEFLFRNDEKVMLEGNKLEHPTPDQEGISIERAQYSHDLFAEEALKFIDKSQSQPFFLYLPVTIPHANNRGGDHGMDIGMEVPDLGIYADKDWPFAEKGKAAMISRLDKDVGRIVEKLKQLGLDENTIIFFTSDNGPHKEGGAQPEFSNSSGGLRGLKRDLYEGGIRVPMIVRWPGVIKSGQTSAHVAALWDVLETVSEIAEVKEIKENDGISFLSELKGRQQKEHDYLYWEFGHNWKGAKQAARFGKWKAVRPAWGVPIEIYDLQEDKNETTNLAESRADLVSKADQIFNDAHKDDINWKLEPTENE